MSPSVSTYQLPNSFAPLSFIIFILCLIDLTLTLFGGYFRHNIYVVGAGFTTHVLAVLIILALCLLLASSTQTFQLGNMQSIAKTIKSPFMVAITYVILISTARSYQLSVYSTCWRKPCPAIELAPITLTIWSPWMIISHVFLKLGGVIYYAAVTCILRRVFKLCSTS